MKMTHYFLAAACGLFVLPAFAEDKAPNAPPKMIQIFRESVKPGHGAAHVKTEAGWPAAFAKANWPSHYIAMTSMSGPSEAWFISPWDSYGAYEKDVNSTQADAALQAEMDRLSAADGDHLANAAGIFATYREDLSFRPSVEMATMRYVVLTTTKVKPGRTADYVAARKMAQAAHEKLGMDEHWMTYEVTAGMPDGTFLLFLPMKSLAQMDVADGIHGQPYWEAVNAQGSRKFGDLMEASVEGANTTVFAFSPKMSYPSKEWAAADTFWAPKVQKAGASAPAKAPAKKAESDKD
jgi:hypothetical protein